MSRRRKAYIPEREVEQVTALSHEGRGISHLDGKTLFIRGALPGESVRFRTLQSHKKYDEGSVTSLLSHSPARVDPICQHFDICGGCSMQHLSHDSQIEHKQSVLLEQLKHIGECQPESVLPPLLAKQDAYRGKARLGVRFSHKTQRVFVGFREFSNGFFLVDMNHCAILDKRFNDILEPLKVCLNSLSIREHIPQLELATSDTEVALIIRIMRELSSEDSACLMAFGQMHQLRILIQAGKPNELVSLYPQGEVSLMQYELPEFGCTIAFYPTDFTQINADLNRKMIAKAIQLLDPQPDEDILELFCGLGNFTLPIAKQAGHVTAVEGSNSLVERARSNAEFNDIHNVEFHVADLTKDHSALPWASKQYAKLLLDPSRAGAEEILSLLPTWQPKRIVYVSCNPATMARDAKQIIKAGYKLLQAGVMDMFPHTAHVESIAVFERR